MARPRAYNHDIRCPECGSNRMPGNGASQDRQIYRGGDCGRYYARGAADREPAVAMHGAGISQSVIARIVGVTPPAVHPVGQKGGAVNWNEGLYSRLRIQPNRLGAGYDTQGYARSAQMLAYSVALLVADWTAQFNASLC